MSKHLKHYNSIRTLRTRGYTYHEINQKLGVRIPKSTLNYICRSITLTPEQTIRRDAYQKELLAKSRVKALEANRRIQENLQQEIKERNIGFSKLSDREAKIALALLYLGEGAKRTSHRGLCIGSSDPKIITIFLGLMERCYGIKADEFKVRISYRADQNLDELEYFWSRHTKIPRTHFYKTIPDPRTVGKPTSRSNYKGVCVLTRKGTAIQLELQMIADIMFESMGM